MQSKEMVFGEMSVGERYHAPLRKTFLKLQSMNGIQSMSAEVDPESLWGPGRPEKVTKKPKPLITVDYKYLLSISVMCVNSKAGPKKYAPFFSSPELCQNYRYQAPSLPPYLTRKSWRW